MKKKILSLLLALVMALSLVPTSVLAAPVDLGKARVIVENTTFTKPVDGKAPAWTGTLVDTWVKLTEESTMMSCVAEALKAKGIRCSVDERNEKLGYRVREAQIAKIPAQIVVGEGECEERTVTIRRSGQKQSVTLPLQEAIDAFVQEIEEKRA